MPTAKLLSATGAVLNTIMLDAACVVISEAEARALTLEQMSIGYFYTVPPGVTVERLT